MGGRYPPLTCRQVKAILKRLGFRPQSQHGSHQHRVRDHQERRGPLQ